MSEGTTVGELLVRLRADGAQLLADVEAEFKKAAGGVERSSKAIENAIEGGVKRGVTKAKSALNGLDDIGKSLDRVGRDATLKVSLPIAAAFGLAIKSSADLGESINKAQTIFGAGSAQVQQFADTATRSLGLSKQAALDFAGGFGVFTRQFGDANQSAAASIELAKRAADISSLFNVSQQQAADALKSGLAGQSEPLRQFGVLLDEGKIKAEAYGSGIAKTGADLTSAQKVQATYAIIMRESAVAAGDFAKTQDSIPNQLRVVSQEAKNLGAEFGETLAPATKIATGAAISLLRTLENLPAGAQGAVAILGGITAAAGPVLTAAGNAARGISAIGDATAKLRNADGNLTGVGKAMAGLGIAGTVAGGVFILASSINAIEAKKASAELLDLQAKIAGLGNQSVKTAAAQIVAVIQASKGISDLTKLNPFSAAENKLRDAERAFQNVRDLIKVDPASANVIIKALEAIPDPGKRAAGNIAGLRSEFDKLEAISKKGAAGLNAAGAAAAGAATDFKALAEETDKAARAAFDAQFAPIDELLNARSATDALAGAIDNINAATGRGIAGQIKDAESKLSAARAASDQAARVKELADAKANEARVASEADRSIADAQKRVNGERAKAPGLARALESAERGVATAEKELARATDDERKAQEAYDRAIGKLPPKIQDVTDALNKQLEARNALADLSDNEAELTDQLSKALEAQSNLRTSGQAAANDKAEALRLASERAANAAREAQAELDAARSDPKKAGDVGRLANAAAQAQIDARNAAREYAQTVSDIVDITDEQAAADRRVEQVRRRILTLRQEEKPAAEAAAKAAEREADQTINPRIGTRPAPTGFGELRPVIALTEEQTAAQDKLTDAKDATAAAQQRVNDANQGVQDARDAIRQNVLDERAAAADVGKAIGAAREARAAAHNDYLKILAAQKLARDADYLDGLKTQQAQVNNLGTVHSAFLTAIGAADTLLKAGGKEPALDGLNKLKSAIHGLISPEDQALLNQVLGIASASSPLPRPTVVPTSTAGLPRAPAAQPISVTIGSIDARSTGLLGSLQGVARAIAAPLIEAADRTSPGVLARRP